jgi:hypothetical protein
MHGAAPPFRARLGGLSAGPHHRWATPPQPPVPSVWQRSLTHRGGQAALHPDLRDTASLPSSPRPTLGDVAINRHEVEASHTCRIALSMGTSSAAPSSERRGGSVAARHQQTACVPPPPLVGMMALRDRAIARPIRRNHKHTPGARKRATRSQPSACSMRPVTGAACVTRWQARNMTNAARIWPVRPCHAGVTALTIGDSRAFW